MSSVLELRHLATLQAIDEAGSLVEAAERLHVTQSALSHQLKDLEHRLGVALIVRRIAAVPVSIIVLLLLNVGFVLGLFHPGAAGVTYTLLTLLAITLIPAARTPVTNLLVNLVAVLQIVIAWTAALERDVVVEWMLGLAAASLLLFG